MLGNGTPDIPEIEAQKVYDDRKIKKDIVLLDVRTEHEYTRGHIEGSVNIPLQDLPEIIEDKIPDKKSIVYVYCLSGSRSIEAVTQMKKLGYKNVFSMISGLLAWRMKQLPFLMPTS